MGTETLHIITELKATVGGGRGGGGGLKKEESGWNP